MHYFAKTDCPLLKKVMCFGPQPDMIYGTNILCERTE